ncbi:V4R domain-containing protein [Methanocaldococcus sp.]
MEKIFSDILNTIKDEKIIKESKKIPMPYFGLFALVIFDKVKELGSETPLYEIGEEFGKMLNPKSIEEIKRLFELMNFGELEIENIDSKRIRIYLKNPPYCWISKNEPIHDFIGGVLAGCLQEVFKKKFIVNELECVCQGKSRCVFEGIAVENLSQKEN